MVILLICYLFADPQPQVVDDGDTVSGPIGFVRIGKLVGAVTIMVADPFHREAQVVFVAALGHQVKDPVGAHE